MSRLIKYEFRKSMFSKLIIIGITLVLQVVFLVGLFGDYEESMVLGMIGLFFTALAGIAFIGIESILTLYRDLTTKQSYMLFMTPNSSFRILGAKALENTVAILGAGAFFGGLGALDIWLVLRENGTIGELYEMLQTVLASVDARLDMSPKTLAIVVLMALCSCVLRIATGYLAVVLSCTLLSGKKLAGLISFAFYILLSLGIGWVSSLIPEPKDLHMMLLMEAGIFMAWSALMYFVTAWLMDKKLSV